MSVKANHEKLKEMIRSSQTSRSIISSLSEEGPGQFWSLFDDSIGTFPSTGPNSIVTGGGKGIFEAQLV